jgi:hypothetical protein
MVPLEFGFYQIESIVCLSPAVCKAGNAVATPPPQAGRITVVDISQIISRKDGRSTIISFPHTQLVGRLMSTTEEKKYRCCSKINL